MLHLPIDLKFIIAKVDFRVKYQKRASNFENSSIIILTSKLKGSGVPSGFSQVTFTCGPTDDEHSTSRLSPGLANVLDGSNFKNGIGAKVCQESDSKRSTQKVNQISLQQSLEKKLNLELINTQLNSRLWYPCYR